MHIIKNNYKEPLFGVVFPHVLSCTKCESVLQIERADLKEETGTAPGSRIPYRYIGYTCPCCNTKRRFPLPADIERFEAINKARSRTYVSPIVWVAIVVAVACIGGMILSILH